MVRTLLRTTGTNAELRYDPDQQRTTPQVRRIALHPGEARLVSRARCGT
jgi:hypothetical protein